MDTSVGSPRSSSGYGSSEEDHIGPESMTSLPTGNSSEPTTPDSLSPLSSCDPYSYNGVNSPNGYGTAADPMSGAVNDFRFVFDDDDVSIPDLADLEVLQEAAASAADLYSLVDEWSTVTTPHAAFQTSDDVDSDDISPVGSIPSFNSDDLEILQSGGSNSEQCSPGNILVSLLKLPKSELDNGSWLQTFQTSSSGGSSNSCLSDIICNSAEVSAYLNTPSSTVSPTSSMAVAVGQSEVAAMTTPLQRLKALTQDQNSVVNDIDPPCRQMIVGNRKLSDVVSSPQSSASKQAVSSPTLSAVSSTSMLRSNATNRPIVVSGLKNSNSKSSPPLMTSCLVTPRQQSNSSPTNGGSCGINTSGNRKQSHAMTSSMSRQATVSSAVIRRHYSELDDHRYSTLLPVPSSTVTTQRRPMVTTTCGATKRLNRSTSSPQCRKPTGTSILETFLLTNKTLKPNEGSEASLVACGVWLPGVHGTSALYDAEQQVSEPETKRPCSDLSASTAGSLLEHLLTSRSEENAQKQSAAATTSTSASSSGKKSSLLKAEATVDNDFEALSSTTADDRFLNTVPDSFGLFGGEHLLYDSQSMNLGALFGDDMLTSSWTPSCFEDKAFSNEMDDIMQQQARQDEAWLQHYLTDLL